MKTLIALATALLVATLVPVSDAEAKRFGGGGSLGKQYNSMPRQAQPPRQAQVPAAAPAAATTGASRWLGPLAGLAAGGLLASLFFGDAFEGLQIMDILLFAALILGGVMLFRALRRGAAAQPAAASAYGRTAPVGAPFGHGGMPAQLGEPAPRAGDGDEVPVWFDGPGFTEGAKAHFIRLQTAWDQSDFQDIREYTTPQLFSELQRERQRLGEGAQSTEVVRLDAELLGLRRDGDQVVASVLFSGLIREEDNAPANPFREIWHVQHDWGRREGDWLIAGIQQVEE